MPRKEIAEHELVSIINRELSKLEECPGLQISGVTSMRAPDRDGCNWKQPVIPCEEFPISSKCVQAVEQVIGWAKTNFNLKQD